MRILETNLVLLYLIESKKIKLQALYFIYSMLLRIIMMFKEVLVVDLNNGVINVTNAVRKAIFQEIALMVVVLMVSHEAHFVSFIILRPVVLNFCLRAPFKNMRRHSTAFPSVISQSCSSVLSIHVEELATPITNKKLQWHPKVLQHTS